MREIDPQRSLRSIADELNVKYQYISQVFLEAGHAPRRSGRTPGEKHLHPLFKPVTFGKSFSDQDWLSVLSMRTGYSHVYLTAVREGYREANKTFQRRASAGMRGYGTKPKKNLFREEE
jgi:hypothetical protein